LFSLHPSTFSLLSSQLSGGVERVQGIGKRSKRVTKGLKIADVNTLHIIAISVWAIKLYVPKLSVSIDEVLRWLGHISGYLSDIRNSRSNFEYNFRIYVIHIC